MISRVMFLRKVEVETEIDLFGQFPELLRNLRSKVYSMIVYCEVIASRIDRPFSNDYYGVTS